MRKVQQFELDYAGKILRVEIGKLAEQAQGSCTVQYGETVVLATVVTSPEPKEGIDYFPLIVDYEEKLYAAGKIKGSRWIKREGRATDEAILTARVIDRSIRPLFKETERKDVQVMVTVLAVDGENDPDVPSLIAASIALAISPIPWNGPVGAIRIGRINNEWVLNTTYLAREKSDFDLYLAGNEDEVVMIEVMAKQTPEAIMSKAITFGQKHLKKIVKFIKKIQKEVGVEKLKEEEPEEARAEKEMIRNKIEAHLYHKISEVFSPDKEKTKQNIQNLKDEIDEILKADSEVSKEARQKGVAMIDEYLAETARQMVLEKNIRVDGRKMDELRPLSAEVGVLPRVHGSGLFSRGETQVLSIVTLGAPGEEQYLESMEEEGKKRYMHHYNFPGFAIGEVRPSKGPGRREIGHGALAEKALLAVLPEKEKFPYTIRVVSEVLSSNGSSSQASVCGSTLSLMDAGVPISAPVAGVAMGLVADPKNKAKYQILTDIQGIEDHAFDMDFKIAGTPSGITAIQLDIKLGGISVDICRETLIKAKEAREKILEVMKKAIAYPRPELSPYAPRITTLHINPDKIRDVIGPCGKVINKIIEECDVQIDIEPDGTVFVTSTNEAGLKKALKWIELLTKEVQIGEEYEGTITQIVKGKDNGSEIGAIVEILPSRDGMVHISNLAWQHVNKVSDILKIGDKIKVKVIGIDKEKDRVELSRKELLEKPKDYYETKYNEHRNGNRHYRGITNHNDLRRRSKYYKKPHY